MGFASSGGTNLAKSAKPHSFLHNLQSDLRTQPIDLDTGWGVEVRGLRTTRQNAAKITHRVVSINGGALS